MSKDFSAEVEKLLSKYGNDKCFECGASNATWVSYPFSIVICGKCAKKHKKTFTKPIYRLLNCLMYEDNYTRKTSKYQVTQFAVWNYPKYTSDFTVQNKLIIDKNYVV
jgi:hypothetical protein